MQSKDDRYYEFCYFAHYELKNENKYNVDKNKIQSFGITC